MSGEDPGADMRRPFARYANDILRNLVGSSKILDLGEPLGELDPSKVRLRDALQEGHLRVYVRQESGELKRQVSEHKITSSVIALGIVMASIYAIRHHKK